MKLRLAITTAFFAVVILSVQTAAQSTPEDLGLKLEVSSLQTTYRKGQDVVLRIALSNGGKEPVCVPNGLFNGAADGYDLEFQIYNDKAEPTLPLAVVDPGIVPQDIFAPTPTLPPVLADALGIKPADKPTSYPKQKELSSTKTWNVLRPGYAFSREVSLQKDLPGPIALGAGSYTISVSLSQSFPPTELEALKRSSPHPFFNGRLVAIPIRITYGQPPTKQKLPFPKRRNPRETSALKLTFELPKMADGEDVEATAVGFRTRHWDGAHFGYNFYKASDGQGLSAQYGELRTADEAKCFFDWNLDKAAQVFETGYKRDREGRIIGHRAEVLLKSGWTTYAVVWTDGATFRAIYARDLAHAVALEKQY